MFSFYYYNHRGYNQRALEFCNSKPWKFHYNWIESTLVVHNNDDKQNICLGSYLFVKAVTEEGFVLQYRKKRVLIKK